jgi:BlaI family penicillinase repressor
MGRKERTMSKYPDLSQADEIIMEILWRNGKTNSSAIVDEVKDTLDWSRQTVRTYLVRLMDKGLVGAEEINGRAFRYYPIVSKEKYAADKTGSFFDKYYDSLSHMVAGIVETADISEKDLNELEALIKELKSKEGN